MQRSWTCFFCLCFLIVFFPRPLQAKNDNIEGYGPLVGLSLGPDQLLLGGEIEFSTPIRPIHAFVFADIGFGDDLTTIGIGPSFVAVFPLPGQGQFYGGAFLGLNYVRLSDGVAGGRSSQSKTDIAVAANFGWLYPLDGNDVLFDLKIDLENHADVKVLVGYQIGMGSSR